MAGSNRRQITKIKFCTTKRENEINLFFSLTKTLIKIQNKKLAMNFVVFKNINILIYLITNYYF